MRFKKIIAGIMAFTMSAAVFADTINIYHETKVAAAENETAAEDLPEWIPRDLSSAVEFLNKYGTTHAEGDYVCLVYDGFSDSNFRGRLVYTDTFSENDVDMSAEQGKTVYNMSVFKYEEKKDNVVAVINDNFYTFIMTDKGYEETDIFSWLPDCKTEFDAMAGDGEKLFVRDGKIVFLETARGPAGYSWITLSGENMLRTKITSDCNTVYEGPLPTGGASNSVVVMTPVSDGYIDLHMVHARSWEIEESKIEEIHKYFKVSNNCTKIEELPEKPSEIANVVYGNTEYSVISDINYINSEGLSNSDNSAVITSYEELEKYAGEFLNGSGLEQFLGQFDEKSLEKNVLLLYRYNNEGGPDSAAPFNIEYDGDHIKVKYYCNSWSVSDTSYLDVMSVYFPKDYYGGQETVWEEVRAGCANAARFSVVDYDTGELIPDDLLSGDSPVEFRTIVRSIDSVSDPIILLDGRNEVVEKDFGELCLSQYTYMYEIYPVKRSVPDGYWLPEDGFEITEYRCNDSIDVKLRIKKGKPENEKKDPLSPGDIDGNDVIELSDLTLLSQYILKDVTLEGEKLKAADCNGDGTVDITDLALLKQYVMHDDVKLGIQDLPEITELKSDIYIFGDDYYNLEEEENIKAVVSSAEELDAFLSSSYILKETIRDNDNYSSDIITADYIPSDDDFENNVYLFFTSDASYYETPEVCTSVNGSSISIKVRYHKYFFRKYLFRVEIPKSIYNNGNIEITREAVAYPPDVAVPAKPVIYLYPEETKDINVKLNINHSLGDLTCTYPLYNEKTGWNVTAEPDSTLHDASGREYSYLFWEGVSEQKWDMTSGFVVKGCDTASFLQEKLEYLGLSPREYNEFIVYWLPQMQNNKYNLISFQTDKYEEYAPLEISPEPDSIQRVFMTYLPLEKYIDVPEQQLESFERHGYTVIEWGGTKISSDN